MSDIRKSTINCIDLLRDGYSPTLGNGRVTLSDNLLSFIQRRNSVSDKERPPSSNERALKRLRYTLESESEEDSPPPPLRTTLFFYLDLPRPSRTPLREPASNPFCIAQSSPNPLGVAPSSPLHAENDTDMESLIPSIADLLAQLQDLTKKCAQLQERRDAIIRLTEKHALKEDQKKLFEEVQALERKMGLNEEEVVAMEAKGVELKGVDARGGKRGKRKRRANKSRR